MKKLIIGLTGASGSIFFKQIVEELILQKIEIYIVATPVGKQVFEYELKMNFQSFINNLNHENIHLCESDDMFNKIASGSFSVDGMIILPCSMGTIGKVANGTSDNLLIRACDVQLKEKRKVLIAFRESPLSSIHLNNLLTLSQTGAIIYPIIPAFYNFPETIDDIIKHNISRILSYFDIRLSYKTEWNGKNV